LICRFSCALGSGSTDDATGLEEDDIIAACLEPKSKFRILSLDGGGIRGILTIMLLQRIQQEVPDFLSKVDLIAGTSTGGIVALLLAAGYSPKQCEDMYRWAGPHIFER
jgi:patatin-like phospholipase/acyl hydrolase